jgi:hypothetical protein
LRGWRRLVGANAPGIAQLEFRLPASSFGGFAAAVDEIAAPQRGWRDFRMAPFSCELGDEALPKNWTRKRLPRLHQQEQWRPR